MKYFGYAECAKCKDQNGPWILENNQFLCEDCYNRSKAVTLAGGDREFAKNMRTHALSPSAGLDISRNLKKGAKNEVQETYQTKDRP